MHAGIREDFHILLFEEGQTKVYENLHVYPRAFFVKEMGSVSMEDLPNVLFDPGINLEEDAVVILADQPHPDLGVGNVDIQQYSPNKITLKTQNASNGLLVLTDTYYPTWHAYIDGKETHIYQTDLALRSIYVTKGQHTVEFRDQLF